MSVSTTKPDREDRKPGAPTETGYAQPQPQLYQEGGKSGYVQCSLFYHL